jgi:hypothetical protein
MRDKLDFYIWRLRILLCYFKHDWTNTYTRVNMGGHYSGKMECKRCYCEQYFAGEF